MAQAKYSFSDTYVLVVDDDPDALALMSALVGSIGVEVRVARDGHEALARIHERTPGFVVLDLMMPGMDGFGVMRRLQFDPKTRNIPILILTAARLQESDVLDLRGTVLGVIRKGDLDLDDVSRVILETLKERHGGQNVDSDSGD